MGLFDFVENVIDGAAKFVQDITGETERRELVSEFKAIYTESLTKIKELVEKINKGIDVFNETILILNNFRLNNVRKDLNSLYNFLSKFGKINNEYIFIFESEQENMDFPQKMFASTNDYIQEIDMSQEEVFFNSFFNTPILDAFITKNKNLETIEKINQFKLDSEANENLAEWKLKCVDEDLKILKIYADTVNIISSTISNEIIPEMELVEAFLECEEIKNTLLANKKYFGDKSINDITLLMGTKHEKHYKFIKNAFLFFSMSKKIYETPILTNLLSEGEHYAEEEYLELSQNYLIEQKNIVENEIMG